MSTRIDDCLVEVRDWANNKIETGREPPWAWYQYMKLVEAVESIRHGRGRARPVGANSPQAVPQSRQDTAAEQGGETPTDSERSPDDDDPPPLPM